MEATRHFPSEAADDLTARPARLDQADHPQSAAAAHGPVDHGYGSESAGGSAILAIAERTHAGPGTAGILPLTRLVTAASPDFQTR